MSRTRRLPQKSPSERLRIELLKRHRIEQSNVDFDTYYLEKMELIINLLKTPK